ncbi:hypothetical protein RJT34_20518 [Clitoria ternatea]|uniref:Uncharacterized protein n=1 Tax=Clitoria ternatea TaxID=43366 RepID=A0AAN9P4Z3_CLITE
MWCCKIVIPNNATSFGKGVVPHVVPGRRRQEVWSKNSNEGNPKAEQEREISGSDVLWALQRASARKKNKKKENPSSAATPTPTQQTAVYYTDVPPLFINPNWPAKLDHLEIRLRQLSDQHIYLC